MLNREAEMEGEWGKRKTVCEYLRIIGSENVKAGKDFKTLLVQFSLSTLKKTDLQ